jgi:chromosomal replication initiation ATPase DnaA
MNLRLFQMSKKGTKAQKAGVINRERINQREKDLADQLLNQVANHLKIMPEAVKTGYKAQGDIGMARTIVIGLLREKLPWSSRKIGEYMGIKRGIHEYLYKISQNKDLQKIFRELLNVHQGRVRPPYWSPYREGES